MKQAKMIDKHVRARRADLRDAEVGRRVRARRLECRLSQTELADRIGVTFQQVQKYEKGVNRIGAGRLQRISEALEVPISFFFGGGTGGTNSARETGAVGSNESVFGFLQTSGSVRIVKAPASGRDGRGVRVRGSRISLASAPGRRRRSSFQSGVKTATRPGPARRARCR
jgi:transcriptional regulator with XRE-family HTH domain